MKECELSNRNRVRKRDSKLLDKGSICPKELFFDCNFDQYKLDWMKEEMPNNQKYGKIVKRM